MILLLLVSLVVATASGTKSTGCDITSSTPFKTRLSCGGVPISITHRDTPTSSFFSLSTPSTPDLIAVTYSNSVTNSNKGIEILVNGERRELSDPLVDLLTSHPWLGAAARTVHDKLKLPAWKRPSVMFLYRLGMAAIEHPEFQESEEFQEPEFQEPEFQEAEFQEVEVNKELSTFWGIDEEIAKYHGPSPTLTCKLNGTSAPDTTALIEDKCFGVCGPALWHNFLSVIFTRDSQHHIWASRVNFFPLQKWHVQLADVEDRYYRENIPSYILLADDEEEPSWAGEWVKRNHKLVTFLGGEGDGGGRVGETKPQVRAFPDETKAPIAPCNCRVQSTFRLVWKEVCTL
eukprot:sb/3466302/